MTIQSAKPAQDPKNTVEQFFEKNKVKILDALPSGFDPDRFIALLLNEMRRVPDLQKCTQASLFGCMIKCAQLGLEPGNGQVFLNPRLNKKKNTTEAEFQLGYPGYLALAYRSNKIDYIDAMVVKEKDHFEIDIAKSQYSHIPFLGDKPGNVICAYAIIHFTNGNKLIKYCPMDRINVAYETSSNKTDYGPWNRHFDRMCQKTAIINMLKYSELTAELMQANESEHNSSYDIGSELGFVDTYTGEVIEGVSGEDIRELEQAEALAERLK